MGWFGTGAMDGDDGMDLRSELFAISGVKYNEDWDILSTEAEITTLLNESQDKIYDWLRDYDWSERYNPGFIQEVYIQATAQVLLDYNVKVSERGKPVMLEFIRNDHWSEDDKERRKSMIKLYRELENN